MNIFSIFLDSLMITWTIGTLALAVKHEKYWVAFLSTTLMGFGLASLILRLVGNVKLIASNLRMVSKADGDKETLRKQECNPSYL